MPANGNPPSRNPEQVWLEQTLPLRHELCVEIDADLHSRTAIPVDVPDKSFFGDIMERAVGLSICQQPPYPELLEILGNDHADRLLHCAGYRRTSSRQSTDQHSWQRSDTTAAPSRLFLTAYRLAQLNKLLHPPGRRRPDSQFIAHFLSQRPHGLPFDSRHTNLEWQAFTDLWASHNPGFAAALRSYGKATAQVPLLGGLRHADFLIGTTIVEVKSGRLNDTRYLTELIDQMIRYPLLAHHDGHPITHVAAYAIRYQRLLRFPIEPLLNRLAGRRLDIDRTSADFAALIQRGRHEPPEHAQPSAGHSPWRSDRGMTVHR